MKEKVVLAYSGGLDTSVILKWLTQQDANGFIRIHAIRLMAHNAITKRKGEIA